jgi:TPR repeat protein
MYMLGHGLERNDWQAVSWYRKAAEGNDATAGNLLAVMYLLGRGVVADEQQAVAWFRKAAEQGSNAAQRNLRAMINNSAVRSIKIELPPELMLGFDPEDMANNLDITVVQNEAPSEVTTKESMSVSGDQKATTESGSPVPTEAAEIQQLRHEVMRFSVLRRWKEASKVQKQISDLYLDQNLPDEAVAARLHALALHDIGTATYFGSEDNYFHLLQSSCEWSRAGRWALAASEKDAALFMAKLAVNRLQQARRQLGQLAYSDAR